MTEWLLDSGVNGVGSTDDSNTFLVRQNHRQGSSGILATGSGQLSTLVDSMGGAGAGAGGGGGSGGGGDSLTSTHVMVLQRLPSGSVQSTDSSLPEPEHLFPLASARGSLSSPETHPRAALSHAYHAQDAVTAVDGPGLHFGASAVGFWG